MTLFLHNDIFEYLLLHIDIGQYDKLKNDSNEFKLGKGNTFCDTSQSYNGFPGNNTSG